MFTITQSITSSVMGRLQRQRLRYCCALICMKWQMVLSHAAEARDLQCTFNCLRPDIASSLSFLLITCYAVGHIKKCPTIIHRQPKHRNTDTAILFRKANEQLQQSRRLSTMMMMMMMMIIIIIIIIITRKALTGAHTSAEGRNLKWKKRPWITKYSMPQFNEKWKMALGARSRITQTSN